MLAIFTAGFILGISHAFETDHLTAVATLSMRGESARDALQLSVSWGLGHTTTLFLTVVPLFVFGLTINEVIEARLEAFVGVVLVFLGLRLIWLLWKDRVRSSAQRRSNRIKNCLDPSRNSIKVAYSQTYKRFVSWPSMVVGLIHGVAGAAALLLYVVHEAQAKWMVIPLVLIFGFGSVLGMALMSQIVLLPVKLANSGNSWLLPTLRYVAASAAITNGAIFIVNGLL